MTPIIRHSQNIEIDANQNGKDGLMVVKVQGEVFTAPIKKTANIEMFSKVSFTTGGEDNFLYSPTVYYAQQFDENQLIEVVTAHVEKLKAK